MMTITPHVGRTKLSSIFTTTLLILIYKDI
jgi:hypothetical protein